MQDDKEQLRYINVESIMSGLMMRFSAAEEELDKEYSELTIRELEEFKDVGISLDENQKFRLLDNSKGEGSKADFLPLISLVPIRRCRIAECTVEFTFIPENNNQNNLNGKTNLSITQPGSPSDKIRVSRIRISKEEMVKGEFYIDGKLKATAVLK